MIIALFKKIRGKLNFLTVAFSSLLVEIFRIIIQWVAVNDLLVRIISIRGLNTTNTTIEF